MNKDQIIGNWEQIKGSAVKQWGKLTDDSITEIKGDRMKLAGKVQESYGIAKEEAEEQVKQWEESCAKNSKDAA